MEGSEFRMNSFQKKIMLVDTNSFQPDIIIIVFLNNQVILFSNCHNSCSLFSGLM